MLEIPILTYYKPKGEKELHNIIEKEIDSLEKGFKILKYEFATGKGFSDFLAIDSERRLVIIEVKLEEDKNILCQALRYYVEIDKFKFHISKRFSKNNINTEEDPRIVLIAEKFSDDLRKQAILIEPDVDLYEYTVLITPEGKKGITYKQVDLPKIMRLPVVYSINDHREFIKIEKLRSNLDDKIKEIKSFRDGIDVYATKTYIGLKYKGRNIAWIETMRKSYKLGTNEIDKVGCIVRYPSIKIETEKEDPTEIFKKIKFLIDSIENK